MDLNEVAEDILFGRVVEADILKTWEYRKGKSITDIREAALKALKPKNGRAKIETEISMLAIYLGNIIKKKKVK